MATITLTAKNAAQLIRLGNAIAAAAATAGAENQAVGTFTVTDASPMVLTSVDLAGVTRTLSI